MIFYIDRKDVCAIIVAGNRVEALFRLNKALPVSRHLNFPDVNPEEFIQVDPLSLGARLLNEAKQ